MRRSPVRFPVEPISEINFSGLGALGSGTANSVGLVLVVQEITNFETKSNQSNHNVISKTEFSVFYNKIFDTIHHLSDKKEHESCQQIRSVQTQNIYHTTLVQNDLKVL